MKPVRLEKAGFTCAGRRQENQDFFTIEALGSEKMVLIVADGMGGHQGGAYASRRATEVVCSVLRSGASLQEAVTHANRVLNEEAEGPGRYGMGTTMVGALVDRDCYYLFNVGDSRAYRIDAEGVWQITIDHSFISDAVRSGAMTAAEAMRTQWAHALTRSLGGEPHVDVDIFGPFKLEPDHMLVLCTDGVYRSLPPHLLKEIALETPDVDASARAIVDVAFRRGSDDNLTVLVLEIGTMARRTATLVLPPSVERQMMDDGGTSDELTYMRRSMRRSARYARPAFLRYVAGIAIGCSLLAAAGLVYLSLGLFVPEHWKEEVKPESANSRDSVSPPVEPERGRSSGETKEERPERARDAGISGEAVSSARRRAAAVPAGESPRLS